MSEKVEYKEYVSVNEKEFGKKESLKLTVNGSILDNTLKQVVQDKVRELNQKINDAYDVDLFDKGLNKIGDEERKVLIKQLTEIIKGFNAEIARMEREYIGRTKENIGQIRDEISKYFSDKSLFVEKGPGIVQALKGYSLMDREIAKPNREKQLPLN